MIEFIVSIILVFFVPTVVGHYLPEGSSGFKTNGSFVLVIILINMVMNMIRAYRYCTKEKSWGISNGFKKGLLTGLTAVGLMIFLEKFPETALEVKALGEEGPPILMAAGYFLSYMLIAYPIWGGTC
jgi:hypothetical protein